MPIRETRTELTRTRDGDGPGKLARAARAAATALVRLRAARLVREGVRRGVVGVADTAASRILDSDELARELALLAERSAQRHGREAVTAIVLRRNLLLDGTILRMIEPALHGEGSLREDAATVGRALDSVVGLVGELASLDGFRVEPGIQRAEAVAVLEAWELDRAPLLCALLTGDGPPHEGLRLALVSYTAFLQSFLLRTSARMATGTVGLPFARVPDTGVRAGEIDVGKMDGERALR